MTDLPTPETAVPSAPRFQIFPAIGIARVGDSRFHSYIASEAPQIDHVPEGGYRGDPEPVLGDLEPLEPGDLIGAGDLPRRIRRIKRMGCRFRIYQFEPNLSLAGQSEPVREINLDDAEIEWHVQLVNRKAGGPANWGMAEPGPGPLNGSHDPFGPIPLRFVIDSGERMISGRDQGLDPMVGQIMAGQTNARDVKLGDLATDSQGNLVVYGGHGVADSWKRRAPRPDRMRTPGWYDDTSDGIVRATVRIDGETHEALAARIVVGPPDYVHPCVAPVTLFDLAFERSGGEEPETSFTQHIHPILHRSTFLEWTLFKVLGEAWGRTPKHGHGYTANHDMHPEAAFFDPRIFNEIKDPLSTAGQDLRAFYLQHLKDPSGITPPGGQGEDYNMPAIEGLTLTQTQYDHFARFAGGQFDGDWTDGRDPCELGQVADALVPVENRPAAMNRAAMDFAVGGPFFPGVEVGVVLDDEASYVRVGNADDAIDFRVADDVSAGALTATLAVPWQVALNQHNYQPGGTEPPADNLWPSARPVVVAAKQSGTTDDQTWTRPFTQSGNDEDIFENQKMGSNRQMLDYWSQLGFIAPAKFYIETDRTLPEDPDTPI